MSFIYLASVFVVSFLLTAFLIRFAPKLKLVDIPNHRSLHSKPVPRGGGIAFVLTFLASIMAMNTLNVWILAAGMVAVLGLLDDVKNLSSKLRLAVQIGISVITAVYVTGETFMMSTVVIAFLFVWAINIYNFMDGSDGLAGSYAVTTSLALYYFINQNQNFEFSILAFSVLGFLIFNLSPAKIFMGDVGSGFLGFVIAYLNIKSIMSGEINALVPFALYSLFIADTAYTLLIRAVQKINILEAHRSHGYQKLVTRGWSHKQVNYLFIAFNVLVAAPVAFWIQKNPATAWIAIVILYVVISYVLFRLKAGYQGHQK